MHIMNRGSTSNFEFTLCPALPETESGTREPKLVTPCQWRNCGEWACQWHSLSWTRTWRTCLYDGLDLASHFYQFPAIPSSCFLKHSLYLTGLEGIGPLTVDSCGSALMQRSYSFVELHLARMPRWSVVRPHMQPKSTCTCAILPTCFYFL